MDVKEEKPVEEERCIYESTSETKMMEDNECSSSSNFIERSVEEPSDMENPGRSLTFQEKLDLVPSHTLEGINFLSLIEYVWVSILKVL